MTPPAHPDDPYREPFEAGEPLTPAGAGASAAAPKPLTVTQLAFRLRRALETELGEIEVEGEISNWKHQATSGHAYFSLKDERAQISCVMWRASLQRVRFQPREGLHVEARGRVTFYEPQGRAQIVIEELREAGLGRLWKKFQELKDRLQREGLFDPARKRPIPTLPRRIGIVTSPSGAVIRDMLNVLGRRFSGLEIVLWPARVQGDGAAMEIAHAIKRLAELNLADVLIVGRGGGSVEDLWAFNEEVVARAIAACPIPVISAVGHETDFTIADFVADLRAPTPSAAAELVVGERAAILDALESARQRLARAMLHSLELRRARLRELESSWALREPTTRLQRAMQRRDELAERLQRALSRRAESIEQARRRVAELAARMNTALLRPLQKIETERRFVAQLDARLAARQRVFLSNLAARTEALRAFEARMARAQDVRIDRQRRALASLDAQLNALDPRRVLERGYAIVRRQRDGRILRDPANARAGDHIRAELACGTLRAVVVKDEADLFE